MLSFRLYMLQRLSALIMAPLVFGHIAVMIYAIQGGLSAEEILGRTQGSVGWGLFYGLFVIAVSIHAGIGVSVIAAEWLKLNKASQHAIMASTMLAFLALGFWAVIGVTMGGGP